MEQLLIKSANPNFEECASCPDCDSGLCAGSRGLENICYDADGTKYRIRSECGYFTTPEIWQSAVQGISLHGARFFREDHLDCNADDIFGFASNPNPAGNVFRRYPLLFRGVTYPSHFRFKAPVPKNNRARPFGFARLKENAFIPVCTAWRTGERSALSNFVLNLKKPIPVHP